MFSFLTALELNVVCVVGTAAVCLSPLGTKLKDWVKGIPADVRTALNGVEKTTAANIKTAAANAHAHVLASLPVPAVKPIAPAPVAPVAPPPAPAPVAPAA